MRSQWSICLAYKKFHLALKMLLSNALWQPVITLPISFIELHILLSRDQGCELIGGFPHCRRRGKNSFPFVPSCKKKKSVTLFI
jgi:hypothetical protein